MGDEYRNYNGYSGGDSVDRPIVLTDPQYVPENKGKKTANTLGIISIVGSLASCCCCGASAIAGIIMSAIGLSKDKKNMMCIIGLIISIIMLLYVGYSIHLTYTDPNQMAQAQQMADQIQQMLGTMPQQ